MLPHLLLFVKITWSIQGLLWFHMNFSFFISLENSTGIMTHITLNLQITLGSINILSVNSSPYTWDIFLFVSFPLSSINVVLLVVYSSFTFFVKFIPKYFTLFDVFEIELFS